MALPSRHHHHHLLVAGGVDDGGQREKTFKVQTVFFEVCHSVAKEKARNHVPLKLVVVQIYVQQRQS